MAGLGSHIRLESLHINELPNHPALNDLIAEQTEKFTRPDLRTFVTSLLLEAYSFTETIVPRDFTRKGLKESSPSASKVELLSHSYSPEDLAKVDWQGSNLPRPWSGTGARIEEHWFARRSQHTNRSETGTADYAEFDDGLRHDHSEHERQYTPDVYDSFEVLNWDDEIQTIVQDGRIATDNDKEFTDIRMGIREMCHKIPWPLNNRTFPVVVLTAKGPSPNSFLVVQIPVDIRQLKAASYSNGQNTRTATDKEKKRGVTLGVYTSIERGWLRPDETVEWLMATASDAKGSLPMSMQRLGVPGAVVKDVGLFMKWTAQNRERRGP